jgi:hypothetical protein
MQAIGFVMSSCITSLELLVCKTERKAWKVFYLSPTSREAVIICGLNIV